MPMLFIIVEFAATVHDCVCLCSVLVRGKLLLPGSAFEKECCLPAGAEASSLMLIGPPSRRAAEGAC